MPTHLLLLPRELRDDIYKCILAPTGTIILFPTPETDVRRGSSPVTLVPRSDDDEVTRVTGSARPSPGKISVALMRTCRQIHAECHTLLFKKNTVFFRDPNDVDKVMCAMGQKRSREIQRMMIDFSRGLGLPIKICYSLPPSAPETLKSAKQMKGLKKVVRKSLSRARQGKLRELGILISGLGMMPTAQVVRRRFYEEFLSLGRTVEHWGDLKRYVAISMSESSRKAFDAIAVKENSDPAAHLDHILMKIHFAWGGDLLFNGEIIWKNHGRVADIPPFNENDDAIPGSTSTDHGS